MIRLKLLKAGSKAVKNKGYYYSVRRYFGYKSRGRIDIFWNYILLVLYIEKII